MDVSADFESKMGCRQIVSDRAAAGSPYTYGVYEGPFDDSLDSTCVSEHNSINYPLNDVGPLLHGMRILEKDKFLRYSIKRMST